MSPTTDIKQEKSPDSLNGQTKLDDTPPGPLSHPSVYTEMQKAASAMAQGQAAPAAVAAAPAASSEAAYNPFQ